MYRCYRSPSVSWGDNQTSLQLETELADAVLLVDLLKARLSEHRAKCELAMPTADEMSDSETQHEMWRCLPDAVKTKLWDDYQEAIHNSACNMTSEQVAQAN